MKKEIVEKTMKMLPDVKTHNDDIIDVRIIRFLPTKNEALGMMGFLYHTLKFKKSYKNGLLSWRYVSTFADKIQHTEM